MAQGNVKGQAKIDPALKCSQAFQERSGQTFGRWFECLEGRDIADGRMSEYQLTNLEDPDEVVEGIDQKRRWTRSRILSAGAAWTAFGLVIVVGVSVFYTCLSKATQQVQVQAKPLNLFVFGDSNTSIGFDPSGEQPSPLNPLGNPPYPGKSRDRLPNWVGWLAAEFNQSLTLAYDYAISGGAVELTWQEGQEVRGYIEQVTEDFVPYAGKQYTPYLIEMCESGGVGVMLIVVSWIGINDLRLKMDIHDCMTELFDMAEVLYLNGARKFIYMTVPPLERTPADLGRDWYKEGVQNWNSNLNSSINQYTSLRADTQLELYDTDKIFNRVLDDPTGYGFVDAYEVCHEQQCVWFDYFHPGSAFYKVLAKDLAEFMEEKFDVWG